MGRSRGRWWAKVVTLALLAAGELVVAHVAIFYWPPDDAPRRADAVLVFAGDPGERLPTAIELLRQGVAPVLVISNGTDSRFWPSGVRALCGLSRPVHVECPEPDPPENTQAEARAMSRLASERGWRKVILVTSTFHVARARLLFDRCYDGSLSTARADTPPTMFTRRILTHEWLGLTYHLVIERGC